MTQSDSKLAKKWGADARTIRRWRNAGAPLNDPKAMPGWLASRKNLPVATRAMLATMEAERVSAASNTDDETPANTGAASALRRLESAERVTYKILQSALKAGSPTGIKIARENWLAIGNQLRQYDRQVERDRRDSGDLVPRKEMEAHVQNFMHALRMAARQSAMTMATRITTLGVVDISEALKTQFWDNMLAAFAILSSAKCAARLPGWWIAEAIKDSPFRDPCEALDRRRMAFETLVDLNTGQRMDQIKAEAERHSGKQSQASAPQAPSGEKPNP